MKTKVKKFSHKLLALFMAVIMALTCFTGAITAFGQSVKGRYDGDLEYNDLAWPVLSDEQVATAVLDFADEMLPALKNLEPTLAKLAGNADIPVVSFQWDLQNRQVNVRALGSTWATVTVKLGSVDEIIETLESVHKVIHGDLLKLIEALGLDLGIIENLDLSSVNGMRRNNTSSCDIIRGVLGLLYKNNDLIFGNLLRGTFSLGVIPLDIYDTLGGLFGAPDGYESNFAYNVVQSLLFNNTQWFTNDEIEGYKAHPETFVFDEVLLEKMTTELLDKINVLVTYPDGTSSADRKEAIDARMQSNSENYATAAAALGYDPNLIYSTERGHEGNVLLFAYGNDKIKLTSSDSLFSFGYQALDMAWKTVLKDTVKLIHVNYDVDRGHGSNFDNQYYYWASANLPGGWDSSNPESMYSDENVKQWAEAVYDAYGAETSDEFLGWVKNNFEYDRGVVEDATGTWRDINSNTLFNKLRYSPLADYYFKMQTGPINLYFMQLGTDNLDDFFDNQYANYSSLLAGLNDALVAAVKDIFVDRDNIYVDEVGDTNVPAMKTTGDLSTIEDSAIKQITETLTGNALKIVQYVADTTDKNILNGFYTANGGQKTDLTEDNLEGAMIPLLISCIGQINLGSGKLSRIIHPADWDACKDAEGVAFVCLREYLSYVLPGTDYNQYISMSEPDNKIEASLDGTILPMARDAIMYIIESAVQINDSEGNVWKAEDPNHKNESVLVLLNNVVCQFADYYKYDDGRTDRAYGVAPLLGICDKEGNSLINKENTIWKNIDALLNELIPVLGELQGKGAGHLDSEELIWNDIVKGVLDIADTSIHTSGMGGVSNFIYRLLSIVSSAPIQSQRIVDVVYDFLKNLINGLFGPRYDGQQWYPIPDRTTAHPFDDLLQKETLGGTGSDNVGAVQKAVNNFIEFSGFGYNGVSTYKDTLLPALTFAVATANNYIGFLPNIADHSLKLATAEFADPAIEGAVSGHSYPSTVTFTNNSEGINLAYVDGMKDNVEQLSRYYMQVTDVDVTGNGQVDVGSWSHERIAPGESISFTTNAPFQTAKEGDTDCVYTATITYNITDSTGQVLHSGLVARAYQYMTSANSWAATVYPGGDRIDESGFYQFPTDLESNTAGDKKTVNGFNVITTPYFSATSGSRLIVNYPEYVVLSTDDLSAVNNYGIRVRNQNTGWGSNQRSFDGVYYYDNATVHDDGTNSDVPVNNMNAIPVFDKTTGDLLKIGMLDYSTDAGKSWERNGITGYTESEINTKMEEISSQGGSLNDFRTRTHVAYTLQEARDAKIIAAYHLNDRGTYDYVYMKTGEGNNYDTTLGQISMRGPIDGFYLNTYKVSNMKGNSSQYIPFLQYDGETEVQPTTEPIEANLTFYHSANPGTATFKFVIADTTSSATGVQEKYDELSSILANYKDTDYKDPLVLSTAQDALKTALATLATPLTPDSAKDLNDDTQRAFVTSVVASATGDAATTPIKEGQEELIPASILNNAYFNEENQIYYYDKEYVAPIYSTTPLTKADVVDGKDAAGVPVTEVDGVYYYTNTPYYEKTWDTETFNGSPWYKDTDVQAKDENGNLLYNQIQFTHYNDNGQNVRYVDDWEVMVPQTSYQIIPSEPGNDHRGIYTQANEYLDYVMQYVRANINTSFAQKLLEDVSLVRNHLNANNFEVVTYNKMVDMAHEIESQYSIDITYTKDEPDISEDGSPTTSTHEVTYTDTISFSDLNGYLNDPNNKDVSYSAHSSLSSVQVDEYIRLFELFMGKVVERGYIGDQLEAEIECASGNTYDNLKATVATYGDEGNLLTPAKVEKGNSAVNPKFGVWSEDGTLVNEGDPIYSDETWNAYVEALANAVALAQLGNGDYAHKDKAYFDASAGDYNAQVTGCYTADTALQRAEIALKEAEPAEDTITVSGTVMIATDTTGTSYTKGIVGINVYAGEDLVATSEADGTFTAVVPAGTTELKFTGTTTIDRTVTLNGTQDVTDAIVPIVICDYNRDTRINATDKAVFNSSYSDDYNVYCDFNGDSKVNSTDKAVFNAFYGQTVNYSELALDV